MLDHLKLKAQTRAECASQALPLEGHSSPESRMLLVVRVDIRCTYKCDHCDTQASLKYSGFNYTDFTSSIFLSFIWKSNITGHTIYESKTTENFSAL